MEHLYHHINHFVTRQKKKRALEMVPQLQLFVILVVGICFIGVADGECEPPEKNIDTEPYYKNCHKDDPLQYNGVTLLINGSKADYPINIDPPNFGLVVETSGVLADGPFTDVNYRYSELNFTNSVQFFYNISLSRWAPDSQSNNDQCKWQKDLAFPTWTISGCGSTSTCPLETGDITMRFTMWDLCNLQTAVYNLGGNGVS